MLRDAAADSRCHVKCIMTGAIEYIEPRRASESTSQSGAPVRQNWILGPSQDWLLIIAAPVLGLLFVVFLFQQWGLRGVLLAISIYNIAHHFPTFIRIYGDRRLMERFKWSLLLGPVVPFALAMGTVFFVIQSGRPISFIYHLLIVVVLWAPWHLLMQHYGFVRIYDRHNQAPRRISARMDLWVCWAWFAYLLAASLDWLPNILYEVYYNQGLEIVFALNENVFPILQGVLLGGAVLMTVVYIGYLVWCHRKGFFISWAKLLLCAVTLMCLAASFLPGGLVSRYVAGWSFALGFSTLSFVHNTQYFAIVWKYNRSLANKPENVRSEPFRQAFTAFWPTVLVAYIVISIIYGMVLAQSFYEASSLLQSPWLVGIVFSLAFTSEMMHYYYDGFIWKVRHRENRQHLDMAPSEGDASWSDLRQDEQAMPVLGRQVLYMGLPMMVVMFGFWSNRQPDVIRKPENIARQARSLEDLKKADAGIADVIRLEKQMVKVRPRAMHYVKLGDLYHWQSYLESMRARFEKRPVSQQRLGELQEQARQSYKQALQLPPPLFIGGDVEILDRREINDRAIGKLPPDVQQAINDARQ
jgi:hypothetical protein